jgi:hypothetical protein
MYSSKFLHEFFTVVTSTTDITLLSSAEDCTDRCVLVRRYLLFVAKATVAIETDSVPFQRSNVGNVVASVFAITKRRQCRTRLNVGPHN